MKHILIPTDFSDNSWNALFTGLKLFPDTSCHFLLLNAYEPKAGDLLGKKGKDRLSVLYESMEAHADKELDAMLAYLSKNHHNENHSFEKLAVADDLVEALEEQLLLKDIYLIIMGTQGATGAKGVFIGSNTVSVLKKVRNCPVLAVPESFNFQALKQVVFPTDFTRHYDPGELRPLLDLLHAWNASLLVLHLALEFELSEEQQAIKKLLVSRLQGIEHSFHKEEFSSDFSTAFADFAREHRADMMALIHYKHSFMEKLTREPVINRVAFTSALPILVLPDVH